MSIKLVKKLRACSSTCWSVLSDPDGPTGFRRHLKSHCFSLAFNGKWSSHVKQRAQGTRRWGLTEVGNGPEGVYRLHSRLGVWGSVISSPVGSQLCALWRQRRLVLTQVLGRLNYFMSNRTSNNLTNFVLLLNYLITLHYVECRFVHLRSLPASSMLTNDTYRFKKLLKSHLFHTAFWHLLAPLDNL